MSVMQQLNPAAQSPFDEHVAPAARFAIFAFAVAVAVAVAVADAVVVSEAAAVAVVSADALAAGDATSGTLDSMGVIVTVDVDGARSHAIAHVAIAAA